MRKLKSEHKHVQVEYKMVVSLARETVSNRFLRCKNIRSRKPAKTWAGQK